MVIIADEGVAQGFTVTARAGRTVAEQDRCHDGDTHLHPERRVEALGERGGRVGLSRGRLRVFVSPRELIQIRGRSASPSRDGRGGRRHMRTASSPEPPVF
jgi:hypothetical protein